ncbi:MBL fold metallo-hydrolase [Xanthomonas campestris pv. raphani]|uniref:MBL fold metallo-hydrolase n=1 Tax=Xanthomonas campestris TaxID=339 RepID=UPI001E4C653B|nr:MBL fold metallo-hydrolase [Xanthomonas campestris]MCC8487717.1 MBL fold metallo-hydrolase [Xanthomonas campestris]MEA9651073.1 MBL fold metallo-hydrolase [Xanthomonas campestris pv. raphani]MEA9742897.1 MBL fold metallo-hydrolase [Xanthomonas campestris pv. raphani]MEA9767955.1 MBL fold metallo-hydrolase [Xanthomonas campestris pv. raphani]MEA9868513.1 MBL fold metallo-hydrolase [Xanthomonas campestris pv. raphani]
MRVHHLNCISTCPLGGHLMDGRTHGVLERGHLSCHCLLVETNAGLVLIDTGFGLRDVAEPRARLSAFFLALVKPDLREDMTAIRQIQRLGFDPRDVRHIVLTHLDFDHAGGLDDFPHARVHLMTRERDAALAQHTWMDRQRFRPQQWSTRGQWRTYDSTSGAAWMGLECVHDLHGLPPEILLVPLPGHTFGHAAVAVRTPERWLLLAGDAYFYHREMDPQPYCTPGLRFYQWMLEKDRAARLHNQQRLRALRQQQGAEVEVFCSHDVVEFERIAGLPARLPAGALQHAPTA